MGALGNAARIAQWEQDAFDQAMADYIGINRTDLACLDIIERMRPITAGQLAEAARLTSGAVTAVLDRLEQAGLVERIRDTEDRRRVFIEISAEAMARFQPIFQPLLDDISRVLEDWADEELATLVRFHELDADLKRRHATRIRDLLLQRARNGDPPDRT